MAKMSALTAVGKLVAVLEQCEAEDRLRAVQAALTILGDSPSGLVSTEVGGVGVGSQRASAGEKAYFDLKEPRTKGEELAVAARFREERENATESTRTDLETVIRAARRDFDTKNFRRDLDNARRKGLFNSGTGKDAIVLSSYGQSYVDALPSRDAVKAVRKPKRARRRRKTARAKSGQAAK